MSYIHWARPTESSHSGSASSETVVVLTCVCTQVLSSRVIAARWTCRGVCTVIHNTMSTSLWVDRLVAVKRW